MALDSSHKRIYRIGRAQPEVDLHLDSTAKPGLVSRLHAEILYDATKGGWILQDRSQNGVFVNDIRQDRVALQHGDVIAFGGGGLRSTVPIGQRVLQPKCELLYRFDACSIPKENEVPADSSGPMDTSCVPSPRASVVPCFSMTDATSRSDSHEGSAGKRGRVIDVHPTVQRGAIEDETRKRYMQCV